MLGNPPCYAFHACQIDGRTPTHETRCEGDGNLEMSAMYAARGRPGGVQGTAEASGSKISSGFGGDASPTLDSFGKEELNVLKWGNEYRPYQSEVPRFNLLLGLWRWARR
jgi:hypothetical protein